MHEDDEVSDDNDYAKRIDLFPVDSPAGSPERLGALDRMSTRGRARISDLILPEEGPQPPTRGVFSQRLRDAAADGVVLAAKYGLILALWLAAGYVVGKAYVDIEGQRAQVKELTEQMKTIGPQALRGQQAFQFLSMNEKAVVALVNEENERQKKTGGK